MPYALDFSLALGSSKTSLTLAAQIIDTVGSNTGSAVTTGFVEIGNGYYLWHYAAFPDGHRGGVKFYENGVPGTILAFAAVNPEEAENSDVAISSRSVFDSASDEVDIGSVKGVAVASVGDFKADVSALATAAALAVVSTYVDDLETRLTAVRAGYLDNLSGGGVALEATLTAMRGAGWTTETLKAIYDRLDTLGSAAGVASALGITISQNSVTLSGAMANFYPGETVQLYVTCKIDGVAQNITADTVKLTMKSNKSDADSAALLQKTADVTTYGVSGIAYFNIPTTDTDDLDPADVFVDIVWTRSAGSVRVAYDSPITILERVSDP